MEEIINKEELVSRYIKTKSHIKTSTNSIKHGAFMPPKDRQDLSVFRILGLTENDIWSLADKNIPFKVIARANLKVNDIENINFLKVKEDEPPERHANIINFPIEREDIIEIAKELAICSNLVLRN